MRCKTCHYSLKYLTEHRCPECGGAFDPDDPSTFETKAKRKWWHFALAGAFLYLALFGLSLHEVLTRPTPAIINNAPGLRITHVPQPLSRTIVQSGANALIYWPFVAAILLVLYISIRVAIEYAISALRWARVTKDSQRPEH